MRNLSPLKTSPMANSATPDVAFPISPNDFSQTGGIGIWVKAITMPASGAQTNGFLRALRIAIQSTALLLRAKWQSGLASRKVRVMGSKMKLDMRCR